MLYCRAANGKIDSLKHVKWKSRQSKTCQVNLPTIYPLVRHRFETDQTIMEGGGGCVINGTCSNSRGVAILFRSTSEYKIMSTFSDNFGNLILVGTSLNDCIVKVINIYALNSDRIFQPDKKFDYF